MSDEEDDRSTFEEESSTSEEEDEDGKEWNEDIEKTFLKTLSSLKKKDPKIYDANVKFFNNEEGKEQEVQQPGSSREKAAKEAPMYLRDYERKIILEKGGLLSDEETDLSDNEEKRKRAASPTYVEEQKALKNSFKKLLSDGDDCDVEEDDTAGFLKVKVKNATEKATEEAEYVEWLKGHKSELNDKKFEEDAKYLRDYWADPNLDEGEQFLRDYVLNKKYLEEDEEDRFGSEVSFSEEEKILKECEEYEQKYNFRFEEPDQDFIKTYPRVIEDSLRRKDDKRKRKREERKKRKEETLERKRLEVKHLKKQKREELMEKINKLKELTGNKTLGFNDEELERDFDASEFDNKMKEIFNDEFYEKEGDLDPTFDFEEDEDLDGNEDCNEDFIMDCDYDPEATRDSKFKKQTRSSRRKGHKKTTFAEAVEREKPVFDPADKSYQDYLDEYYELDFEDMIYDMPCRFKYRNVPPNDFGLTIEEILAADDKELNQWCSMKKVDAIRPEQSEKFDKKIYQKRAQNLELKKKFLPSLFSGADNAEQENSSQSETVAKKKKKRRRKKKSVGENKGGEEQSEPMNVDVPENTNQKRRKRKAEEPLSETPSKKKPKSEPIQFKKKKATPEDSMKKSKSEGAGDRKFKNSTKNSQFNQGTSERSNEVKSKNKNFKFEKGTNKSTYKFKNSKNSNSEKDAADGNFAMSDERLIAYGFNPKKYKNKMKYGKGVL